MTRPRQVLPGATYMVSRRCSQRQFLLAPSHHVNQVFLFCLAVAAQRTGVVVHAVTVMSNHYHLVATDPQGRLPEFCAWLHEFVARSLNAHYGRWENFWASEPTSCVRLIERDDIVAKTVYTLANPVAAALVSHGDQWPGVRVFSPGRRHVSRPDGFFRPSGPTPEEAVLNIVAPPVNGDAYSSYELVRHELEEHEERLRAEYHQSGRRFLGARAVLAQSYTDRPDTDEPRRGLSPSVACRNKWLRIDTLLRCKQFLRRYREALRCWSASISGTLFPPGTYQMARRFGVSLAPS